MASRISRDRFFELHRYLHFADNSSLAPPGSLEHDKLGKVNPIIEKLSERFRSTYTPQMNVTVDEAIIPFKGRSTLKQYMPLKPVRRGIKVWALADSLNGFISQFEVYTGKKANAVEKNLGSNVVKTHTALREHIQACLLRQFLYRCWFVAGLYGCGTLWSNRKGFPEDLKPVVKKGMKQSGESQTRQYHNLTVRVWQDNKAVTVAVTNGDPTIDVQVMRKKMALEQQ